MKKFIFPKMSARTKIAKLCLCLVLPLFLLFASDSNAKHFFNTLSNTGHDINSDTSAEKKVDYIERIYFSGLNKAGLNALIATTLQSMEAKPATEAVVKQYVFLAGIKDQAIAAESSCDVEEMLAAGIYDIDPNEALLQAIPQPSPKIGEKIGNALASVNNLSNSTVNASAAAFILSNGKVKALGGALAGAQVVSNVTGTFVAGKQVYDDAKKIVRFFSGDKACKRVPKKEIQIGEHIVLNTNVAVDK